MKGFLYFLGGVCAFTEISMFMRATNGLEEFSFIYIITMIIIGAIGLLCFSKGELLSKSIEKTINSNKQLATGDELINKYKTLVDYIISLSNGRITNANNGRINIDHFNKDLTMHFCIVPIINQLQIDWEVICPSIGNFKHQWEFNEMKITQSQMAEIIESDAIIKGRPYLEALGLNADQTIQQIYNALSPKPEADISLKLLSREDFVRIVETRKIYRTPGKYSAKVTNLTTFTREDGTETIIVSIAGMTPNQLAEARKYFDKAELETNPETKSNLYQEALNQHLAVSRRLASDWIPEKGEIVDIELDIISTKKDPGVKALLIIGMSHRKAETAPNVNFSEEQGQDFIVPLKLHIAGAPISEIKNEVSPINQTNEADTTTIDLVSADNIMKLFIPLDIQKKATVLAVFMQIKHDNNFINNLFELNNLIFNFLFGYDDYEGGYEHFKVVLSGNDVNLAFINEFLKSIKINLPEFLRLSAILHAVNGEKHFRDRYISLAYNAWQNVKNPKDLLYSILLIKTKADLLIYEKSYFEAASFCESAWDLLQQMNQVGIEKTHWLKYQIALTLIKLSKHVKMNLDLIEIAEQLDQLQKNAEMDDCLNLYLADNFPKSNLSLQFEEIVCEICFTISLMPNENVNSKGFQDKSKILYDVFNDIFNQEKENIWVLINEWYTFGNDYTIDQFSNLKENCFLWESSESESQMLRKQVFLIKSKKEINFKNLFQALINSHDGSEPEIDSRIYFINPLTDVVFMFWDDSIFIGSKSSAIIKPIYEKYYPYINDHSRAEFEKHLN